MKVIYKHMLSGYTGSADGMIYYWDSRLQRFMARRKPTVKISTNHTRFAAISRNISSLDPSPRYKDDLRTYAERTFKLPEFGGVRPIWNNLFHMMMHRMKKMLPSIDLTTITKGDIHYDYLPVITVRDAVDAGLLPPVRNYEELDNEI
ncbi:MAG: hypothetical protein U1B83_00005 [Candidatus Cloacimonadaceae bacterium]|nr:hypothetical protein [Candidatus Cloacimonadaceae bacterium]